MSTITTIITTYRRPENIRPLVDAVLRQSVASAAVWAWANDPSDHTEAVLARAKLDRVVICSDNARFHGRFALALLAQTEYVAILDDDSIPGDLWFANCLETMEETPGILGTAGVVLHGPGYSNRTMHGWQRPSDKTVEVDLVGQAWFLRTDWVKYLFGGPPVTGTNGEDIELAARAWRLAGVRSFCPPHPSDDTRKWGSTRGLELGLDEMAASRGVGHLAERKAIVEAEMAAGWKPLFMRRQEGSRFGSSPEADVPHDSADDVAERSGSEGKGENEKNGKMQIAKCKLRIAEQSPTCADSTSLTPALSRRDREEDTQSYVQSERECCPKWVTTYSYPMGDNGQARMQIPVTLRLDGGDGATWCVDCLNEIESLGGRASSHGERSSYDCIDLGPALEYVRDPQSFLRAARRVLKSGGELQATVTNVGRESTISSIINGRWHVDGALRLRYFTRREVEKLFLRARFLITSLVPTNRGQGNVDDLHAEKYQVTARLAVENHFSFERWTEASVKGSIAEGHSEQTRQISEIAARYPWPSVKPPVSVPATVPGWLSDATRALLKRELSERTQLVIELGAWLGESTRFILDSAPNATVISIDHWRGSPEHHESEQWRVMLPQLYESFLSSCWEYRSHLIPLKSTTLAGLQEIADLGLAPDVIFIDAEHSCEAVSAELDLCQRLFPNATLVGDDFDNRGVHRAVQEFAEKHALTVVTEGSAWRSWKFVRPAGTERSPESCSHNDLTSIVILTHDQLAYTRACLESIRFLTDEPYELIVVDNGSTDGTVEFLRSCPDVKLIENADNRGFPAAANQGIKASSGAQVLLLNNDIIVTTGWLDRLRRPLLSDVKIGMVGPLTNCASGYQEIPVSYADTSCLDGFAWEHAKQHDGELQEVDRLIGFCLLIRRDVVHQVGLLDERFGIGNYEDDDYCRRARNAGWRLVVARDAFIHHFGHRTFDGAGVDLNALLIRNRQVYDQKWAGGNSACLAETENAVRQNERSANGVSGLRDPLAPRAELPFPSVEGGAERRMNDSTAMPHQPPSLILSLCVIVRNNAGTIRPCLESAIPWVDEVIVVDTGSTDETPQICREVGAQVYHFPWPDSFAVARNESLKYARGEWIFWMDSDDVIDAENGRKLRALAYRQHDAKDMGYIMQVHCPGKGIDGMHDVTVVDHLKLFRNRPDLRFEGRIHEQIMEAITRAGGDYLMTDIFVVHAGADRSPEGWKRKLKRDIKLLRLDRRERPNHPFVHFNFGMTYVDAHKFRKAIKSLRRSLELSPAEATHVRKVYALLVISHRELGERQEARQVCEEGLKRFPKDPELLFRNGILLSEDRRFRAAEQSYFAAIANNDALHVTSIDRGMVGFKARHNLAGIYTEMGALHKAEDEWRKIVAEVPTYRDGWRGLCETLLMLGKLRDAEATADQLLKSDPHLRVVGLTLVARIAEVTGNLDAAVSTLRQARYESPDDIVVLDDLCRILFVRGEPCELEEVLRELVRRQPDNAAAHHNLGTLLNCSGRFAEAVNVFRASLRERPDFALTHLSLGYALSNVGKRAEAGAAFEQCVRLATEPRLAAEAQRQLAASAA